MNIVSYIGVLVAAGLISTTVSAADVPAEIVTKGVELQKTQPVTQASLQDRWEKILEKSGWGESVHEGGVLLFPERNLIVSSGEEFTRVPIGQPGWVESRVVAYERAELQAKAKIVSYFTQTTDTTRSLEMLEQASWSDGTMADVRDVGEIASVIERIGKKSLDVTDAMLDKALRKLDPDYDPAKYERLTTDKLQVVVEDLFKRRISSMAFRSLVGVTPVYTTEGEVSGQYQVLVGVVWSPKLNNVALSLGNDVYNLPPVQPGDKIETTVPEDPNILIGTLGTRVVVDENGQFAVIAYAQAQPRRAAPSRQQSAIHTAKKVAENRARGQLVNFVKESISVRSSETSSELSREYSDLTVGTEAVRNYQEKIIGSKIKVSMRGLRTLKEWQFPHPVTGEPVVGAVLAWTPRGAAMASEMEQVMTRQSHQGTEATTPKKETHELEKPIESMPVNTSHY